MNKYIWKINYLVTISFNSDFNGVFGEHSVTIHCLTTLV